MKKLPLNGRLPVTGAGSDFPSAEQIFAGLPDALLIIDNHHRIKKVNPVAENFLGQSSKTLLDCDISDQIQFEDNRLTEALLDSEANVAARRIPIRVRGRDVGLVNFDIHPMPADDKWRIVSIAPMPSDGPAADSHSMNKEGFSVKGPDILGHEIKNPLAAIKGAAQLLDRKLDEEQKALTGMIKSEVARIAQLLDRVQSLSTTLPAKVEPTNIHSIINQARLSMETASKGRLKILDQFDPSLPEVLVDPEAMMQVLTNLLSNAADAINGVGNPEIMVTTRYSFGASFSTRGNNQQVRLPVEITIRDNGPGVPAELEAEIFSPFVSTKPDGQGLGLALVRKLMADMNGRIRYERNVEHGHTQFVLFLPVADKV